MPTERDTGTMGKTPAEKLDLSGGIRLGSRDDSGRYFAAPPGGGVDRSVVLRKGDLAVDPVFTMQTLIKYVKEFGSDEDLMRMRDFFDAQHQLLTQYLFELKRSEKR